MSAAPAPLVAAIAPNPEAKVKEDDIKPKQVTQGHNNFGNQPGNSQNRGGGGGGAFDRGPKRKRGGGPVGPGRNSFMGRGGGGGGSFHGGGGGFERRSFPGDFDGPLNKKSKMQSPEFRVLEKLRSIHGPTIDLPAIPFELKKFLANTRLYIGNIAPDVTETQIKDLFATYGEVDEVFINREKNFGFLKLDFRTNAERARSELDQHLLNNRMIKVRFAPATVRVKVKNLNPMVSNELLELAFGIFGDIERALVFVDEKGKSTGEGIVDFTRKNNAAMAHKICSEKCFFITSDLRPVITEMGEMCEMDEGLLEMNLPRRDYRRGMELDYHKAREIGPRIAEEGTFEADYGEKWKALVQEFKKKEIALKEEMEKEIEKLHTQIEMARYDYETEMLRQQLRQREQDHERHKMEYENRVPRDFGPRGGGGGFANGSGPGNAINRQAVMESQQQMALEQMENANGDGAHALGGFFIGGNAGGNIPSLAPPPMPPQGLMAHLQNEQQAPAAGSQGPTWELPPAFGRGRGSGTMGIVRSELSEQYSRQNQNSNLGVLRELKEDDFENEVVQGGILLPNPLARRTRQAVRPAEDDDDCVIVLDEDKQPVQPVNNRSRLAQFEQGQNHPVRSSRDYFPQFPNEFSANAIRQPISFESNLSQNQNLMQRRRSPSPPDSLFARNFLANEVLEQRQSGFPNQQNWEFQGHFNQERERVNTLPMRKNVQVGPVHPWQASQRQFGNEYDRLSGGPSPWNSNFSESEDVDEECVERVYRNPIQLPENKRKGNGNVNFTRF